MYCLCRLLVEVFRFLVDFAFWVWCMILAGFLKHTLRKFLGHITLITVTFILLSLLNWRECCPIVHRGSWSAENFRSLYCVRVFGLMIDSRTFLVIYINRFMSWKVTMRIGNFNSFLWLILLNSIKLFFLNQAMPMI